MDKRYLETEFNTFFEFDSADRSVVTSTSAKMFAEHMAAPIEAQAEQLRAELNALRDTVRPFVRLMKDTSGRIPTELLSFADWHALAIVGAGGTATDGHCTLGADLCNCGGDLPAVRAGCANWIRPNAKVS